MNSRHNSETGSSAAPRPMRDANHLAIFLINEAKRKFAHVKMFAEVADRLKEEVRPKLSWDFENSIMPEDHVFERVSVPVGHRLAICEVHTVTAALALFEYVLGAWIEAYASHGRQDVGKFSGNAAQVMRVIRRQVVKMYMRGLREVGLADMAGEWRSLLA